ncbi:uncharacterized protein EAF01_010230 [Botrytis porri]|uniref:Cytochrome P450 n=1 Tax=Botrytis porri TaxID=87229 RepID=A0A4Z1KEC6_9HELO|nr:uncharacterized protein EAF01_010230 [Botrytis porri]KAF7894780.1 hypothetical protein EAF01_010230 [Botrytis porri]TGO82542.1 hypothetical protein BPOR_0809g00030 [Botrytis porri]
MASIPWLYFIAAAVSGIAAHLCAFIHGDWHLHIPHVIFAHCAGYALLLLKLRYQEFSIIDSLQVSTVLSACYLLFLFTSIIIYRVVFHRLRSFPGPRLAAATKLWSIWKTRDSRNHLLMQRLFEQYGPIVRTAPNELTVFHPEGVELVKGGKNGTDQYHGKGVWYDLIHPKTSVVFNRKPVENAVRRRPWDRAVSPASLRTYAANIVAPASEVLNFVSNAQGEPVSINDLMTGLIFDFMSVIVFGEVSSKADAEEQLSTLLKLKGALVVLAPCGDSVWPALFAFNFLRFLKPVQSWLGLVESCRSRMLKRMNKKDNEVDVSSFFLKDYHDSTGIISLEKRQNALLGNTISALVAGSDTARAAMIGIFYFLCKYPAYADKIYEELKNVDEKDSTVLAGKPFLNAFIKEALRVAPPSMTGLARIIGPQGLWIDNTFIPPGAQVTAPYYNSHRLSSAFQDPTEFIAERWTSRPDLIKDKRAYAPWGAGQHICPGKALANVELRYVTALFVKTFKIKFAPGHDPEKFWTDMLDQVTMQPGDIWCVFEPRN